MQFNNQTKGKLNMKKLNIALATILLVLGCFSLSPAVKAADGPPIVGLWDVTYTSDNPNNPMSPFETYQQWHSDGQEIESQFLIGTMPGHLDTDLRQGRQALPRGIHGRQPSRDLPLRVDRTKHRRQHRPQ
jgi:hypothetical protein